MSTYKATHIGVTMTKSSTFFRSSSDRKVAPYGRKKGKSPSGMTALKNSFGLPAGKDFSCPGATEWCLSNCYAGKLERLFPTVRNLLLHNWDVYQENKQSWLLLQEKLRPMLNDFIDDCSKREVEPVFRWFWDGDIPNRNFAKAIRNLAWEYPNVKFWAYTRNFDAVNDVIGPPNFILYLSVDAGNMLGAFAAKQRYPEVKLAFCADTWEETESLAYQFDGERKGPRCPELTGKLPLVVWDTEKEGHGACVECNMCIDGLNNVRFASQKG